MMLVSMRSVFLPFVLFFLLVAGIGEASAQTTILNGQNINASAIPVGNTITINAGGTLNMDVNRTFASITTANIGTSSISGVGILTVSGVITIVASSTLSLNTTATAASLVTANLNNTTATISGSGNLILSGNITINGVNSVNTTLDIGSNVTVRCVGMNGGNGNNNTTYNLIVNGFLRVSGVIETGATGIETFTCSTASTIEYNGAAQAVFVTTYHNLVISGSGTKTAGIVTINGDLTIGNGATFLANSTLLVNGETIINGGISFGATNTKIFVGLVTINNSGVWTNSVDELITFRGGITNSGIFIAGNGVHTFNSNSQQLTGIFSIPNVRVNVVSLTNNNELTVATALDGTGTLVQASNAILNVGGGGTSGISISTLNATAIGNTVNYNGGAQTLKSTTYHNLTLSGTNTKTISSTTVNGILSREGNTTASAAPTYGANATLQYKGSALQTTGPEFITNFSASGGVIINNANGVTLGNGRILNSNLTLTDGILNLGNFNLTIGLTSSIIAPSSSASMIVTSGTGELRKIVNANGSFTFPVGDNVGTPEYSPITVSYTGSAFAAAYVAVSVVDDKHPNNTSTTDFLTRYWNVRQSGITGCLADITATYVSSAADISGTEASIVSAQYTGATPWIKYSPIGSGTLSASGASITTTASSFTGIHGSNPVATITNGASVETCSGIPVNISTSVSGSGSYSYLWSPATGLNSATNANPIATPTTTTVYTLTVTDGNGFVATPVNITINVNPLPTPTFDVQPAVAAYCAGVDDFIYTTQAGFSAYAWIFPGVLDTDYSIVAGGTGSDNSVTLKWLTAGTKSISINYTDANGCFAVLPIASSSITINPLPVPSFTVQPDFACIGQNVIYTTEPGFGPNYTWGFSDPHTIISGGTSADNSVELQWLTAGSKTVTINYTDGNGCTAVAPTTSSPTIVNSAIPATPGVITGSNEHCEGTVDLIYSIAPVAGTDSYTWSVPTDWVITLDNGTSITASAPLLSASGNIEVTATNGCGVSAASILPVTVNPLPVPYNVGGGGTYCAGDAGHAVTLSGSELDVNYQLERNGVDVGSLLTGTNSALSFGLQTITGTYTVTATNTITGCIQTMAGSTSIAVNTVTAGTFPNPASICVGGTANLTFTDNGQRTPGAAVTYRWKYSVDNITFNTIEPPTFSELPSFATYTTFPLTTAGNHYFKRVVISTLNGIPCEAEGSAITVNVGSGQPPIRTDEEGLWHTAATWTTGSIPAINDGTTGCPVTVSHNLTIESNLVVNAGVVAISANVTDADGGPSVNLLMDKSPANFSFTQGILEIRSGATVRLQGTALLKTTTLIIRKGGKLVIGPRELEACNCWSDFEPGATPGDPDACNTIGDESYREAVRFTIDKNARVIIEDGAYLIVYGSVSMPDPQTELSVNGEFIVTGNFATTTGSVSIVQDIPGEGDLYTCGTLTTQGSGEIFGTTNDCTETSEFANPPCQASTLSCTFSAFITPGGTSVWCNDVQLEANTNASPLALLKWEYYDEDNTQWIPAPDLVGDINYSLTPDNPPVDEDALYRIRVNSASCTKFSSAVRIRYGTNAWRGNTTNSSYPTLPRSAKPYDWNDQVNWCNNVPLGSENIEITSGTPIIYEGNVALVNNLILGEDAFLSFQQYVAGPDQPELNIFGNFTNYGEIDALVGEVKFTGVDNGNYIETNPLQPGSFNFNTLTFEKPVQLNTGVGLNIRGNLNIVSGVTMDLTYTRINLNGNVAGTQQVNINNNVLSNLTINKGAGNVQFTSMALLGGIPYDQTRPFNGGLLSILTPTTVNANGNLTIRSIGIDYKTDGSIGTMHSGASVTGNVRVQRYMDAVPNAPFRYISSAVDSDPKPPQVDKLLYYDNGWKGASTMLNGVGYTALTYTGSAATFSVRGIVGQKNFTWSTANGKLKPGWNLIGNPYPSAIQWAQSLTDTRWIVDWNNVATLIAITDNSFAGYPNYFRYYDFTDPGFSLPEYVDENGDNATWGQDVIQDGVIVMGQAFWVYASNGASITLTETAKTAPSDGRDGEFYRKKSNMKADSELLTISITNGTQGDQAYLRINPDASHEFDFNLDFPKFKNVGMNLYLQDSMDSSMLILSLPEVSENAPIPLGIEFTEPGEYTISFSDDGKFSYRSKLFLIDQYDGVAVPISTSEPFSFSIPEGSSTLQDRFYLSLTPELKLNKETSVSVYPNPVNDLLNIQVIGLTGTSSATLIDMNGKILISSDFKGDGIIDMKDYPEGMYVLKVKTENGILTKKIVKY